MRSTGNFHPEWGYLAPAPNFMRTIRTALVAAAVGGTAGGAAVLALVDRSETEGSVAARTLVQSEPAAAPSHRSPPQVVQIRSQTAAQLETVRSPANENPGTATGVAPTVKPPQAAAAVVAPTESAPSSDDLQLRGSQPTAEANSATQAATQAAAEAEPAPKAEPAPAPKKAAKKRHGVTRYATRGGPFGQLPGEYGSSYADPYREGPYREGRWGGGFYPGRFYSER